jgi:hypothetical protein
MSLSGAPGWSDTGRHFAGITAWSMPAKSETTVVGNDGEIAVPTWQVDPHTDITPTAFKEPETMQGLGRNGLAILVLLVAAGFMAAPGVIAAISLLDQDANWSFVWPAQTPYISLFGNQMRLALSIVLAIVVWRASREQ